MRIIGIDFQGSDMVYVVATCVGEFVTFDTADTIPLTATRTRDALVAFETTVRTVLQDVAPDRVAVKLKPEGGRMSAGAAALKMEAILLANSPCDVTFVSGQRLKKIEPLPNNFPKYAQPAALVVLAVR